EFLPGSLGDFPAFSTSASQGVFVAAADVNGDGYADVIVGSDGAAPEVKVFSGRTGALLSDTPLDLGARVLGTRVAAGDVNGDGYADVVVGAGPGGAPRVCVLDGPTGREVYNFLAFAPAYRGGVFVAAGDLDSDGRADVVVGGGAGLPQVRIFRGSDT